MNGVKPSAIRELLKNGADPEVINFGGGYPDPELFPLDALQKAYTYTINNDGKKAFQYAQTDGILSLRNKVVERMIKKGVECDLDNVLIVQGAQQGIHLIAKMLLDEGDIVF
jgi:2-aminoadipate transaminase